MSMPVSWAMVHGICEVEVEHSLAMEIVSLALCKVFYFIPEQNKTHILCVKKLYKLWLPELVFAIEIWSTSITANIAEEITKRIRSDFPTLVIILLGSNLCLIWSLLTIVPRVLHAVKNDETLINVFHLFGSIGDSFFK